MNVEVVPCIRSLLIASNKCSSLQPILRNVNLNINIVL